MLSPGTIDVVFSNDDVALALMLQTYGTCPEERVGRVATASKTKMTDDGKDLIGLSSMGTCDSDT